MLSSDRPNSYQNRGQGGFEVLKCDFYPRGSTEPIDFRYNVSAVSINENMFSRGLWANMLFHDNVALRSHLPITGGEAIVFSWRGQYQTEPTTFYGRIRSYKNREQGGGKAEMYTAEVVSDIRWGNTNFLLQQKIDRDTTTEAMKSIFQSYSVPTLLKQRMDTDIFVVDRCETPVRIIPGKWDVHQTMTYLMDRANNSTNGDGDFVLFERPDGLYFVSLQTLIKKNVEPPKYRYSETGKEKDSYNLISDLMVLNDSDLLKGIENGGFSNRTISVDSLSRNYDISDHNYDEWWNNRSSLSTNAYTRRLPEFDGQKLSQSTPRKTWVVNAREKHFFSEKSENFVGNGNVLKNRVSLFASLNLTGFFGRIPGNSSRHVGDIIDFGFPTPEEHKSEETTIDRRYRGKWLLTNVRHELSLYSGNYTTAFQGFKEGLDVEVPDNFTFS